MIVSYSLYENKIVMAGSMGIVPLFVKADIGGQIISIIR